MTDIASIQERAQRLLDGMTINREAFARDVLKLTHAARRLRDEVVRSQPRQSGPGGSSFTDVFGDIFGGRGNG